MLSLQLKSGEYLTIGEDIAVQIFQTGSSFRVAVKAPREIPIVRGEVLERQGEDRPLPAGAGRQAAPELRGEEGAPGPGDGGRPGGGPGTAGENGRPGRRRRRT